MRKEVIIIGASGHGKVIADIIKKSGDIVFGLLDDDLSKKNVMGAVSDCTKYSDKYFIIAIGNNLIRRRIAEEYPDIKYYTVNCRNSGHLIIRADVFNRICPVGLPEKGAGL